MGIFTKVSKLMEDCIREIENKKRYLLFTNAAHYLLQIRENLYPELIPNNRRPFGN